MRFRLLARLTFSYAVLWVTPASAGSKTQRLSRGWRDCLRVLHLGGEGVDTKSATGKLILAIFSRFAKFNGT